MNKIVEAFNRMAALYRHLVVASGMLVAVWGIVYSVAEPYAQVAVLDILKEKGITPESFAAIQKKVDEISKEQTQVAKDIEEVQTDVSGLKKQTDRIVIQQETIVDHLEKADKTRDKIENSIEKIRDFLMSPPR